MAMGGLVIVGLLITLALLAPRYGVDLRDGGDWRIQRDQSLAARGARYTPKADAVALAHWLARLGRRVARAWDRQERAWGALWLAHQPWRGDDVPMRADGWPGRRADDPGAGERGRHRDELRWWWDGDGWQLAGRLLPASPAADDSSGGLPGAPGVGRD
jgi:hypothetical protein